LEQFKDYTMIYVSQFSLPDKNHKWTSGNSDFFLKSLSKTVIILISFYGCKAQLIQEFNYEAEIVGTWVAEGSSISNKWIFETSGVLSKYDNNNIYKKYNWTITNGIHGVYLKIININDLTDIYNYEINALNNERLVLVYQRGNNMGIGKPAIHFRQ